MYFMLKTVDFALKIDPMTTMTTELQMSDTPIDLYEHGYRFAIKDIDKRFGRIRVRQGYRDESGKEQFDEIAMSSCSELEEKGYEGSIFTDERYKVNLDESRFDIKDYICPENPELLVMGNFHQIQFMYV